LIRGIAHGIKLDTETIQISYLSYSYNSPLFRVKKIFETHTSYFFKESYEYSSWIGIIPLFSLFITNKLIISSIPLLPPNNSIHNNLEIEENEPLIFGFIRLSVANKLATSKDEWINFFK